MDAKAPKSKVRLSLVEWLVIIAIVGFLVVLTQPWGHRRVREDTRREVIRLEMSQIGVALQRYRREFGIYPLADNASMTKALGGENSKLTPFLDLKGRWRDTNGGLVDLWHTPYHIETNSTNGLSIRSAGPNRRFGDADDLEQALLPEPPTQR